MPFAISPTLRFEQVSRALVARVFRFLAFLVVEIDHQSGNFSKILPLRSNVHWKKIDSAIMAVPTPCGRDADAPEETTPAIVQCDPDDAAAARPALVVWRSPRSLNAGGHGRAREADCELANRQSSGPGRF